MTLEEAIETLANEHHRTWGDNFPEIRNAVQLGIEALKRIKEGRGGYTKEIVSRLPSETDNATKS